MKPQARPGAMEDTEVCPGVRASVDRVARSLDPAAADGDHAAHRVAARRQPHFAIFSWRRAMSTVQDTVFDIISSESGIDRARITPESTLKELEIQSLDAVQIIFEIEDHFKITMPDRDPNFDTESVKGLVDAVETLLAAQPPAAQA
jgi:acyl carrier protein